LRGGDPHQGGGEGGGPSVCQEGRGVRKGEKEGDGTVLKKKKKEAHRRGKGWEGRKTRQEPLHGGPSKEEGKTARARKKKTERTRPLKKNKDSLAKERGEEGALSGFSRWKKTGGGVFYAGEKKKSRDKGRCTEKPAGGRRKRGPVQKKGTVAKAASPDKTGPNNKKGG